MTSSIQPFLRAPWDADIVRHIREWQEQARGDELFFCTIHEKKLQATWAGMRCPIKGCPSRRDVTIHPAIADGSRLKRQKENMLDWGEVTEEFLLD